MLTEILTWLTTPASAEARRLGYLRAAIGLQSRAGRCRAAWCSHLTRCHDAVRASVARCSRRRTAIVLGSGLGLEFPLDELAREFERVVLADIVHLPAMRRQATRQPNVELLSIDLTALARPLLIAVPRDTTAVMRLIAPPRLPPELIADADWVISCNLLSQLPMLPVAWLESRGHFAAADLERIGRRIMVCHLEWLGGFPGVRCLIADAEQTVRDAGGRLLESTDVAAALDLNRHATASWSWELAPAGELADGLSAVHRVVACDWPAGYSAAAAEPLGNSTSV